MPLDGISQEQKLGAEENVFWVALCWFPDVKEFVELELAQMEE